MSSRGESFRGGGRWIDPTSAERLKRNAEGELTDNSNHAEDWTMKMDQLAAIPSWEWPSDADRQVLAVLENREAPAADRLLAAELAGNISIMNEEMAKGLVGILQNQDETTELRGKCAIALGPALEEADLEGFDDPDPEYPSLTEPVFRWIEGVLRDTYQDPAIPKEVRRRALEASVRAPQPWHTGAVRAAYHDGDPEWKRTAVFCMGFIQGFEKEILEALETDDPWVLRQAVLAAGSWEIADAWPVVHHLTLAAGLEDELVPGDPDAGRALLLAAIHSAAMINPQAAFEILEEILDDLTDPEEGFIEDEELSDAIEEALEMARLLGNEGVFLDEYDDVDGDSYLDEGDFFLDEGVSPESDGDFDDKPN